VKGPNIVDTIKRKRLKVANKYVYLYEILTKTMTDEWGVSCLINIHEREKYFS
jgi:hypothetical protein